MENYHRGNPVDYSQWSDWTKQGVMSDFWERWLPIANGIESEVVDQRYSIGGKMDLIVQHIDSYELALVDYKTKRSASSTKKNHRAQLGGYASLIDVSQRHLTGWLTKAFAFNIFPDRVEIATYDIRECLERWYTARDLYFKHQPTYDF